MNILLSRILTYLNGTLFHDHHYKICTFIVFHYLEMEDMSEEDICFNCKHFIGGGDWGLACAKHYHRLPRALDKMCEDGEFNT